MIEIEERVIPKMNIEDNWEVVKSTTNEPLYVTQKLNAAQAEKDLKKVFQKGITSLAVLFLHSHM